ncbi:MAG: hypothetical protein HC831_26495 [Chloroflexia bacterium]|nr:hypothetical protein [Chloroflexia bacterium]
MTSELSILIITTFSIGFFHTLLGPDHYLPFIALSKSNNWALKKTVIVTVFCGLGHVLSSVILGFLGINNWVFSVVKLEIFESIRGNIAAWLLIVFGFVYLIWGIRYMIRNKTHLHFHSTEQTPLIKNNHKSDDSRLSGLANKKNLTPWVLFIIFFLGPCEPLIPILMYPAVQESKIGLLFVIVIFTITTIATMLAIVLILSYGFRVSGFKKIERYSHALAGFAILFCGLSIEFMGL